MRSRTLVSGMVTMLAVAALACPYAVPAFKLSDSRGAEWTEASLTKKPSILVFLKLGCPRNPTAVPILNQLQKQVGEGAQIVGVVNADAAQTQAYSRELKVSFPLLSDASGVLIKGFKAERSLQFSVVATKKEARWAKLWGGIGQTELEEALKLVTGHGHALPKVDLTKAPAKAISGCSF